MSKDDPVLNRTQCRAIHVRKGYSRYLMDKVRVLKTGVTETTNGKSLVRVYPKKIQKLKKEILVDGRAVAKAGNEMANPRVKRGVTIFPPPAKLDPEDGTLSYETSSKLDVEIPGVVRVRDKKSEKENHQEWPPTDPIVEEHGAKTPGFQTFLGVKELTNVLALLKRTECESVRLDFFSDTEAVRFSAENKEAFVLGIIMPLNVQDGSALSPPASYGKS